MRLAGTKFASVQDLLREWHPQVMAKIKTSVCLSIKALDVDAIRSEKNAQVILDALTEWITAMRL